MNAADRVDKNLRRYVRTAIAHDARIVERNGHIQVFDGSTLVATLSEGGRGHDGRKLNRAWRERGWL